MRKPLPLLFALAAALAASTAYAAAKDSVTIGMALEPPTLDPTTGAAAAIGEITHYNIFEGLVKLDDNFNVTPLLAEKWTFSPDLKTLTFTLRQGVKFQDGESFSSKDVKFAFERAAGKDSTNKEKAFFASIQSIDASDPATVTLTFKEPSFQALYHLGLNTAVIVDEKSAATDATQPVGTGPYKFVSWNKGASATLEKWDGYRDAAKNRDQARHLQVHQRPLGGDGGAAGRRRRRLPALPGVAERRPVPERSALPGRGRDCGMKCAASIVSAPKR